MRRGATESKRRCEAANRPPIAIGRRVLEELAHAHDHVNRRSRLSPSARRIAPQGGHSADLVSTPPEQRGAGIHVEDLRDGS
jgi:hypothetical protein